MAISFTCPKCGTTTQVDEAYAGQTGPCVSCGEQVTVPGSSRPSTSGSGATSVILIVLGVVGVGILVCGGGIAALLIPAISSTKAVAQRNQSINNLKQIGIALHTYHDVHKSFPPAYIPDENGQPMHSWRVMILPYLEFGGTYEQYNFDEPWDSPNNLAVTDFDMPVYMSASDPTAQCSYFVINVPGGIFDGAKANSFSQIQDGTSNTILVVEVAGSLAHWAEPVDLDASAFAQGVNGAHDGTAISSFHGATATVLMADGAVIQLDETTTQQVLQAMTTMSDGQALPSY